MSEFFCNRLDYELVKLELIKNQDNLNKLHSTKSNEIKTKNSQHRIIKNYEKNQANINKKNIENQFRVNLGK